MSTAGGNKVQVAGSSELSTLLLVYDAEFNGLGRLPLIWSQCWCPTINANWPWIYSTVATLSM